MCKYTREKWVLKCDINFWTQCMLQNGSGDWRPTGSQILLNPLSHVERPQNAQNVTFLPWAVSRGIRLPRFLWPRARAHRMASTHLSFFSIKEATYVGFEILMFITILYHSIIRLRTSTQNGVAIGPMSDPIPIAVCHCNNRIMKSASTSPLRK